WSTATSLMLHRCGIAILLLPAVMMMRPSLFRDRLSEIVYFWGTGGAVQALIFPDVGAHGFPTFRFFAFFISHGLIIAGSFALVTSGRLRITIGSLGRHYLATNIILVPIFFIDRLLASVPPYAPGNYFLLGYPPPQGSIVDLFAQIFGPSPWYVIGFEIMGIGVFGILWLPWALARLRAAKRPA
ncbi:MAG: TIGR02206 family membrane protein, partial [Spirochaetaceae bacterium]|nr:TIGR02206 family membrane protein [Spirochaetaceae bacterium]